MMFPLVAQSSWNMTFLDIKLKAFAIKSWRITQSWWRSKVHLLLWITISHPPLIATLNWCGEKCVAKVLRNWKHKTQIVNQYNVSPIAMGWTPLESLVMVKRWAVPKIHAIQSGMWLCAIWKQSWNNWKSPRLNLLGELLFENVQKPSQKDHLLINITWVGELAWRN